jgi:hypothetical protein
MPADFHKQSSILRLFRPDVAAAVDAQLAMQADFRVIGSCDFEPRGNGATLEEPLDAALHEVF